LDSRPDKEGGGVPGGINAGESSYTGIASRSLCVVFFTFIYFFFKALDTFSNRTEEVGYALGAKQENKDEKNYQNLGQTKTSQGVLLCDIFKTSYITK
jgi:hypothetical protein